MAGSNTFGGTIKLEGEKAYREAVKQINSNLRVLASEMGKVTAEFTKNDKSTTALTSRNKILNEQIEKQKEKISVLKNALAQSSEKYGENDKKTNNWKVSLNKAEAELSRMESSLKDVNVQMEKSKTPLDKLNTELSEQGTKLKELQTEYKNVVLSQGKNSSEAKSLASEIKSLNNDIRENKEKLNAAEKATSQLGDEMNDTKNQASKLSEGFTVMKGIIANLATDAIKRLGRDIVGAVKSVVSSGIEFESAFAGVKKTVDATDEEFEQFETGFRSMSTQMPMTASELSAIAEAAGQLGIKNENLLSFTETMANLGFATNMSSDEAATALARPANITGMNQQNFDRLGSSIVALGNNFATTESEVTQMALNISAAGSQVGMTEADILGVAAALSSLGLEAQGGGTAISRAIIMMANACETGSSRLEYFAKAAEMSTAEFQKYFAEDATGALTKFITGLGNLQDESALKFLDDMGISETRLRDALLRASNANAFNFVVDWVKTNWQGLLLLLVNPIAGAFKLIYDNCDGFRNFINNFVNSVKELFTNGWNAIVSFFTQTIPQFISNVGQWFSEMPGKIWSGIVGAIGVVSNWGNQLISAGVSAAKGLVSSIWSTVCELPGKMFDIGKNLVQGLWNGIK